MIRILTVLLFSFFLALPAYAKPVPGTLTLINNNASGILWENIETGDTIGVREWKGGCGIVKPEGTQDGFEFEMVLGMTQGGVSVIDSTDAPNGFRYTAATGLRATAFWWPRGFIGITIITPGGGTQDVDVYVIPLPDSQC